MAAHSHQKIDLSIVHFLPTSPPAADGGKTKFDAIVAETPANTPARGAAPMTFDSSISAAGVPLFGAIAEFPHCGVGGLLRAGVTWPQKIGTLAREFNIMVSDPASPTRTLWRAMALLRFPKSWDTLLSGKHLIPADGRRRPVSAFSTSTGLCSTHP
jgi:hypothetical protein